MWEIDLGDRTSTRYQFEYRYGICDDSIDTVISHNDVGYLVTLMPD